LSKAYVYNNTVYITPADSNPAISAFEITDWSGGLDNVYVLNNIFYTADGIHQVIVPGDNRVYLIGNIYSNVTGDVRILYHDNLYTSLDEWRSATGCEVHGGRPTGSAGNPLFNNPGSEATLWPKELSEFKDYGLQSSDSPAYNAGVIVEAISGQHPGFTDFAGTQIPQANVYDVGAIELPVESSASGTHTTASTIKLAPIPAATHLRVYNIPESASYLRVYTVAGSCIVSGIPAQSECRISTEDWDEGLYIIRMYNEAGTMISQIPAVIVR